MTDPLAEAGPGDLALGDTLTVKGVRQEFEGEVIVSFDMFGSHVEAELLRHKDGHKAFIASTHTERDLSKRQHRYVCAMAVLVSGVSLGWQSR